VTGRVRAAAQEVGGILARALWAISALAIAFGSAGLVASLDHAPGTAARIELTRSADEAIAPGLDAAVDELAGIADEVDRLTETGKDAFVALVGRDTRELSTRIADGTALAAQIDAAGTDLRAELGRLPGTGPGEELRLSAATLARRTAIADAAGRVRGMREAWARIEGGATAAIELTELLEEHDAAIVAATDDGRRRRYRAGLRDLDRADGLMADAVRLQAELANTTDVATLREWLNRSDAYDSALRRLYTALRDSNGRVNDEVRAAFAEEQVARDLLPSTENPLVIIMNDIAQASVNDVLIGIEAAYGELVRALDELETA
jgi:hypothetical protein